MRYRLLRLASRLLPNKINLSPVTRNLCLEHLVVKCLETSKKHPNPTVSTSYRQRAVRTFKKLLPPQDDSLGMQELHKFFLVRMAALIGSKHSTFIFLGKTLLEHAIAPNHPQRKALKWLVDKQTIDARFFETFQRFALELNPALIEHSVFQKASFEHAIIEMKDEGKEENRGIEDTIAETQILTAWKTYRQHDSSEKLEVTKRAILWLRDNIPISGKESHTRLFNHCQFIVQGLVEGEKRLSVLSEDEQFFIADNLLYAIELLSKATRTDTVNETFRLFSLVANMPAPQAIRFEQIQHTEKKAILAQRRLKIATALTQNFLLRRAKNASKNSSQKSTFEALHFLTRFLLTLDLKSGEAYQLMLRAITFLPRTPPHALEYLEAVNILSKLCAHTEGALRTHTLRQHCVLKTLKEGIYHPSETHLFAAVQLCGTLINHRLIIANCWHPVEKIILLLLGKLKANKIKPSSKDLYAWLILPLINTQALLDFRPLARTTCLKYLSDITPVSAEWLPQLLPTPKDLMAYYVGMIQVYDQDITSSQAHKWLVSLPSLSSLDTEIHNLHAQCQIGLRIKCKDTKNFQEIFRKYLQLTLDERIGLLPSIVRGLVELSSISDFNPLVADSLFKPLATSFLPFVKKLMDSRMQSPLRKESTIGMCAFEESLAGISAFLKGFREEINKYKDKPFHSTALEYLSQSLEIAIEEGPFVHLKNSTFAFSPEQGAASLASDQLNLQFFLLMDLTKNLNPSLAIDCLNKVQACYLLWKGSEKFSKLFLNAAHGLGCGLFAQDPSQYNTILSQYERLFQSACNELNTPFAFECLTAIVELNYELSATPIVVELGGDLAKLREKCHALKITWKPTWGAVSAQKAINDCLKGNKSEKKASNVKKNEKKK